MGESPDRRLGAPAVDEGDEHPSDEQGTSTERAAPSDTDAMGLDKRREVTGRVYGPTRARIFTRFAIFFGVVILFLVAAKIAIDQLDKPPESNPAKAPWSAPDSPQREPNPLQ
jgi:hypothetical protein